MHNVHTPQGSNHNTAGRPRFQEQQEQRPRFKEDRRNITLAACRSTTHLQMAVYISQPSNRNMHTAVTGQQI